MKSAVIKAVCDYYEIPESKLMGKTRVEPYNTARHIAMALLLENKAYSTTYVAGIWGMSASCALRAKNNVMDLVNHKKANDIQKAYLSIKERL